MVFYKQIHKLWDNEIIRYKSIWFRCKSSSKYANDASIWTFNLITRYLCFCSSVDMDTMGGDTDIDVSPDVSQLLFLYGKFVFYV